MSKPTTTKKQPNYYTTLSLSARKYDPTLTPAEVKAAYKRALLQHHPDKKASKSTSTPPPSSNPNTNTKPSKNRTITIDTIALAYKILSSPSLKAEYDSHLQQASRSRNNRPNNSSHNSYPDSDYDSDEDEEESDIIFRTGLETVDLDDLEFVEESDSSADEEGEETWTRACRCGDYGGFVVSEKELEANAEDGEVIVGCRGCSLWLRVLFGVEG
jgi:diphthamide biosynthesis protein 4